MSELPVINARVTIANVKDVEYRRKDGSSATFKALGIKNPDDTWLNLSVFDEMYFEDCVPGNVVDAAYTEKYATEKNGQPKMYNGEQVIYRTVTSLIPAAGSAQTTQNAAAQEGQGSQKAPYDPDLGARQTAANNAVQIVVAAVKAGAEPTAHTTKALWDMWFEHVHTALVGKVETLKAEAEEKLDAVAEDDDIPF